MIATRRRSPEESERIYGPWRYRAWGYGQPCVVVGCETRDRRPGSVHVIECCHARTGGMGRKSDWNGNTFFACWRHHDESAQGVETFARTHQLAVADLRVGSLEEAARVTLRAFNAWEGGLAW